MEELLDAANEEERTQIIWHCIEVIELHASDTKGETGTYAMRLFPEVRPDWFVGWCEQYPDELIYHEMRSPETTNSDAAPEGGTAAVLTDSRLVCISDGKAPPVGLEPTTRRLIRLRRTCST